MKTNFLENFIEKQALKYAWKMRMKRATTTKEKKSKEHEYAMQHFEDREKYIAELQRNITLKEAIGPELSSLELRYEQHRKEFSNFLHETGEKAKETEEYKAQLQEWVAKGQPDLWRLREVYERDAARLNKIFKRFDFDYKWCTP